MVKHSQQFVTNSLTKTVTKFGEKCIGQSKNQFAYHIDYNGTALSWECNKTRQFVKLRPSEV